MGADASMVNQVACMHAEYIEFASGNDDLDLIMQICKWEMIDTTVAKKIQSPND